jgi:hypothetical protein
MVKIKGLSVSPLRLGVPLYAFALKLCNCSAAPQAVPVLAPPGLLCYARAVFGQFFQ